jgi:hypothetical protein
LERKVSFNPRVVEAKIAIGWLHPEDLPAVAWDALEAGHDGPTVCVVAGLQRPSGWETDRLLPEFMRETGMVLRTRAEASICVACDMAREILECRKDLLKDLPVFARLCFESDYPKELMGLYMLDDELYGDSSIYGRTLDQVRQNVRDELITLIRRQEMA